MDKQLTLHQLVEGGKDYHKVHPKEPKAMQMAGDSYIYIDGRRVISGSIDTPKPTTLITLREINHILTTSNHKPIKSLADIELRSSKADNNIYLYIKSHCNIYHIDTTLHTLHECYTLNFPTVNYLYNPKYSIYIYTKDNRVYIAHKDGTNSTVIEFSDDNIVLGDIDANRSEMGDTEGLYLSPDGEKLALIKCNYSGVNTYPLVNSTTTKHPSVTPIHYPKGGEKNPKVELIIYNIDSCNYTTIHNRAGNYLTNIVWHPNSKSIYITEVNRAQNSAKLNCYSGKSGRLCNTVYSEHSSKYVEPENKPIFIDDDKVVILSRRGGYRHAYLYSTTGGEATALTSGSWEIISAQLSPRRDALYIVTTKDSPICRTLYSVNLTNLNLTLLSNKVGFNRVIHSSTQSNLYINLFSDSKTPLITSINDAEKGTKYTLYRAGKPLERYNLPTIECGEIMAADNKTPLYYRLVKPLNFNPTRSYPAIVYLYGGPHVQMITDSYHWGVRGWDIYMAQQGYVVFTIDNRGSYNRGFEFESVTHGRLGEVERDDQIEGLNFLTSLPYVDSSRVGIHGWSFGGFMTLNMILNHPDRFKVAVAGGSVTNWSNYESVYTERYMRAPRENRTGYTSTNLIPKATNLNSKLLLIHCDNDPVVPLQHTLSFVKSCIANNKTPQLFIYPNHKHNVIGRDRVHLYEMISNYFFDNL